MERLAKTEGLTDIQRDILATVREFADKESSTSRPNTPRKSSKTPSASTAATASPKNTKSSASTGKYPCS